MHHQTRAPVFRRAASLLLAASLALLHLGCSNSDTPQDASGSPGQPQEQAELILASTTSTQDSGLFDELIPAFEVAHPDQKVKVIAVGTGEALKLGEQKDADVLLVHAKADEEEFVADGYGAGRKDVMYNDFVVVGPGADPAQIKSIDTIAAAMKILAGGRSPFVSRGDDSGTHKKERKLWDAGGVEPEGDWYLETGQGMGETLKVASEKQAYALADRATYLSMKDTLDLDVVLEGQPELLNQYGVIVVTDAKNQQGGQTFSDWICGPEGQEVIRGFGVEKFGQPLFTPNAE